MQSNFGEHNRIIRIFFDPLCSWNLCSQGPEYTAKRNEHQ